MIPGPFKVVATTELASDNSTLTLSDFSGIPAGSKSLAIFLSVKASSGTPELRLRFNSDTSSNYYPSYFTASGSSTGILFSTGANSYYIVSPGLSSTANYYGSGTIIIPHYGQVGYSKQPCSQFGDSENRVTMSNGRWDGSAAISRLDFILSSGNFSSGSVAMLAVIDETYLIENKTATYDNYTMSFSGIPSTSEDLVHVSWLAGTNVGHGNAGYFTVNGDNSDGSYTAQWLSMGNGAFSSSYGNARPNVTAGSGTDALGPTNLQGRFQASFGWIQQYSNGTTYPLFTMYYPWSMDAPWAPYETNYLGFELVMRLNAAAITSIEVYTGFGHNWRTGSQVSIYKLPRARILNHELSSTANVIGGSLTPTTGDAMFGNLYGRTNIAVTPVDNSMLEFNDDTTTSNYNWLTMYTTGSSVSVFAAAVRRFMSVPTDYIAANVYGVSSMHVIKPHKTDRHKTVVATGGSPYGGSGLSYAALVSNRWANTSSITKWEMGSYYDTVGSYGTISYNAKTHFQVEGTEALASAAATSGFFLRFL